MTHRRINYLTRIFLKQKTFILLLLIVIPLSIHSQNFTGYGLRFGYATNDYGWSHPDNYLDTAYLQPTSYTIRVGLSGEFLNRKYISTAVNWGIKFRSYKFDYRIHNSSGAVVGLSSVKNDITWTTLGVAEKFRLPYGTWMIYAYGGFEASYRIGKNISAGFENVFDNSKKYSIGILSGAGIAKGIGNFLISAEFYFIPDLTKTYTSDAGQVRNTEMGISLGFGLFDAEHMLK